MSSPCTERLAPKRVRYPVTARDKSGFHFLCAITAIADAIRKAGTAHEVYFLLTACIEATGYCDELRVLPAHAKDLPLAGIGDAAERSRQCRVDFTRTFRDGEQRVAIVLQEVLSTRFHRARQTQRSC